MFSFKVDEDISIELMQQHHKQELFDLIDKNRVHLRKWLLWVDKRKCPEDLEPIIQTWIRNYSDNNGFDAGIRFKGDLAGMIGLHYIDWKNKTTSIGYFLSAEAQGNGIITRSITSLLDYLFNVMKLNRVQILCAVNNEKSRAGQFLKAWASTMKGSPGMANGYMTTMRISLHIVYWLKTGLIEQSKKSANLISSVFVEESGIT